MVSNRALAAFAIAAEMASMSLHADAAPQDFRGLNDATPLVETSREISREDLMSESVEKNGPSPSDLQSRRESEDELRDDLHGMAEGIAETYRKKQESSRYFDGDIDDAASSQPYDVGDSQDLGNGWHLNRLSDGGYDISRKPDADGALDTAVEEESGCLSVSELNADSFECEDVDGSECLDSDVDPGLTRSDLISEGGDHEDSNQASVEVSDGNESQASNSESSDSADADLSESEPSDSDI